MATITHRPAWATSDVSRSIYKRMLAEAYIELEEAKHTTSTLNVEFWETRIALCTAQLMEC
jgi:hypothetical protein